MDSTTHTGRTFLRDLALLYLTLAHETDQELATPEVEAIARRLQAWEADAASEDVLGAVRDALRTYAGEGSRAAVGAAVLAVGETIPAERRQAIVDDLVEVAMADGKFLHEESTFIGSVAAAWGVHLYERHEADERKWSILSQDGQAGEWTALHDLAILYLTLAHATDDELSPAEVAAVTKKLSEWLPDAKEVDVLGIVQEAIQVYTETPERHPLADAVEAVRRFVPEHQRAALLSDLQHVAHADGVVLAREQLLIDQLAQALRA